MNAKERDMLKANNRNGVSEEIARNGGLPSPVSYPAVSGITVRVRGLGDGDNPISIKTDGSTLDYPHFRGPVQVIGIIRKDGERLTLDAEASAEGDFECTRCADPFHRVIRTPLHLEFVPPRLESDPEDPNIHVYDPIGTTNLDITEDVRDALALAIPMTHLCRPDCKGLCPVCGKDLNKETCNHTVEPENAPHWAALKSLSERLHADESKGSG